MDGGGAPIAVSLGQQGGVVARAGLMIVIAVAACLLTAAAPGVVRAAAPEGSAAPLSRAFSEWRTALYGARAAAPETLEPLGVVPSPVDRPALAGRVVAPRAVALPAEYDLRDQGRVGPARNQLPHGTCWAFAVLGALESSLLPTHAVDLSEDHMVLTAGFDTPDGAYVHGGTFSMAAAYLLRWSGPVLESQDPYGDGSSTTGLSPAVRVQNVLRVPGGATPTDTANVKYALMTYGAVASLIHWDLKYYNGDYWDPGGELANHGVLICGWDDSYPASAFKATPPGDGAWLVRNNWGAEWGRDGFFWVSYYDQLCGAGRGEQVAFESVDSAGAYTDVYSHDPLGEVGSYGYALERAWAANVFKARTDQPVVAVGFYTPVPASSYDVYAGVSLKALESRGSGTLALPGFHTVRLTRPLLVRAGEEFVVAYRIQAPGTEYPISVEYQVLDYSSAATAAPWQSYTRSDEGDWEDLTGWNESANVCLKAYAGTPAVEVPDDVTPPVTAAAGLDGGWHRGPVTVTLTASDPGEEGSGVLYTEHSLDGGPWTRGERVLLDVEGTHALSYRSADLAGNVEEAHTGSVSVDTGDPSCAALPVKVKRGATATVRYRVSDEVSPLVRAVVKVRSASGAVKLKLEGGAPVPAGSWKTWSFRCTLPRGTYIVVVRGTDLAGNRQTAPAQATLRVY
jgi:C1A family cysteine protease